MSDNKKIGFDILENSDINTIEQIGTNKMNINKSARDRMLKNTMQKYENQKQRLGISQPVPDEGNESADSVTGVEMYDRKKVPHIIYIALCSAAAIALAVGSIAMFSRQKNITPDIKNPVAEITSTASTATVTSTSATASTANSAVTSKVTGTETKSTTTAQSTTTAEASTTADVTETTSENKQTLLYQRHTRILIQTAKIFLGKSSKRRLSEPSGSLYAIILSSKILIHRWSLHSAMHSMTLTLIQYQNCLSLKTIYSRINICTYTTEMNMLLLISTDMI